MTLFWIVLCILAACVLIGQLFGRGYESAGWTLALGLSPPAGGGVAAKRPGWWEVMRSDLSPHVPKGRLGFLEFNYGRWMRPVLRPRLWFGRPVNPWTAASAETLWFTIDFPFAGPFIGWTWDGDDKYIGFKRFPLDDVRYSHWTQAPTGIGGSAITFSMRG